MLEFLDTGTNNPEPSLEATPVVVLNESALFMADMDGSCFWSTLCVWHAAVDLDLAADCPHLKRHAGPDKTVILENAGMLLPFSFSTVVKILLLLSHVGGNVYVICITATFSIGAGLSMHLQFHVVCYEINIAV